MSLGLDVYAVEKQALMLLLGIPCSGMKTYCFHETPPDGGATKWERILGLTTHL
jgi:hypothetical protein